jgi:hypothetical protein
VNIELVTIVVYTIIASLLQFTSLGKGVRRWHIGITTMMMLPSRKHNNIILVYYYRQSPPVDDDDDDDAKK